MEPACQAVRRTQRDHRGRRVTINLAATFRLLGRFGCAEGGCTACGALRRVLTLKLGVLLTLRTARCGTVSERG
jgi:hypothetical protein